jgi:hypothetical protein
MSSPSFSPDRTSHDEHLFEGDIASFDKQRLMWETIRDEHFEGSQYILVASPAVIDVAQLSSNCLYPFIGNILT